MSILVVQYDPAWAKAFEQESDAVCHALCAAGIDLHHIGSTAIPGILAKPIIDMLGIVDSLDAVELASDTMQSIGYEVMGQFGMEGRRYFRKFDNSGQRSHQLHVFASGSPHILRHLAFRDYLRNNPRQAAEYSELKAKITANNAVTWEEYMDAKDPFIAKIERRATSWYHENVLASDRD